MVAVITRTVPRDTQRLHHARTAPRLWRGGQTGERRGSGDYGGIFALCAHCALLLDYVPPKEPPSTPLGNALRIR